MMKFPAKETSIFILQLLQYYFVCIIIKEGEKKLEKEQFSAVLKSLFFPRNVM